ncbi:DegT/DnrJ/EryC1/StrS family aminotransferase [Planctomicrobium piriforme]|uniref:DegT/DnrJ/EryC1/StrS family aminotransferase n=1 Tax=Planctomicrobium piriforme TaxID=1576369 RepID=UPI0011146718|nr:aminotransferase class V-fold PLP-dependent enzyme [Planctomicrobium piriforme]
MPALLGGDPVRPQGPPLWPVANPAVVEVLQQLAMSGDWGRYHAGHCERLIESLQRAHRVAHVHLASSGTAAVELALRGLKVGPGDEVILSAYDFKANFTNIAHLGAMPVLVEIDSRSGQLSIDLVEAAITQKTKAILASHLHGAAVDMPRLMELAGARGIPVIEDACQMTLATIAGRPTGTWGDVGVISFGGSKLLTAGRGGAVFTQRDDVLQRIRLFTQRGNDAYPLSEMQAAVLPPQLDSLPQQRATRTATVSAIVARLGNHQGLRPFEAPLRDCELDYYKLAFWYDPQAFDGLTREQFSAAMRAEGIPVDSGFRSLHRIHAQRRFRSSGELTAADEADDAVLTLHHPFLLEVEVAANQFLQALDRVRRHATILKTVQAPAMMQF